MEISLIYHSILLVTSPVSQSQLVQWYISYVAIFEFFHSSVNHSSGVKWVSWVNDDDFHVYLSIHHDIWFVVFQPIGCLNRKVPQVSVSSDSITLSMLKLYRIFPLSKFLSKISDE